MSDEPLLLPKKYRKLKYKQVSISDWNGSLEIIFDSWKWIFRWSNADDSEWTLKMPNGESITGVKENLSWFAEKVLENQLNCEGIEIENLNIYESRKPIIGFEKFSSVKIENFALTTLAPHVHSLAPISQNQFKCVVLRSSSENEVEDEFLKLKKEKLYIMKRRNFVVPEKLWTLPCVWIFHFRLSDTQDPTPFTITVMKKMLDHKPEVGSIFELDGFKDLEDLLNSVDLAFPEIQKNSYRGRTHRFIDLDANKTLVIVPGVPRTTKYSPYVFVRVDDGRLKNFEWFDKCFIRYDNFIEGSLKAFLKGLAVLKKKYPNFKTDSLETVYNKITPLLIHTVYTFSCLVFIFLSFIIMCIQYPDPPLWSLPLLIIYVLFFMSLFFEWIPPKFIEYERRSNICYDWVPFDLRINV